MPQFSGTCWNLQKKTILLDVDGTLVADSATKIDSKVVEVVHSLTKTNAVYLCSNSSDRERIKEIARWLAVEYIRSNKGKPSIRALSADLRNAVGLIVIGDKWLTDGIFALNIGAEYLKVDTLFDGNESLIINAINSLDRYVGPIFFAVWGRVLFLKRWASRARG